MPTLYTMPGTCSLAPNIAIAWLDAPVEVHTMAYGDHKKAAYLAINPKGQVPALKFESGDVLTEAAAILSFLGATWGDKAWARDTKRGRREAEALSYMTSEVHASYAPHFAPQKFIEGEQEQEALKAHAYKTLQGHYKRLEENLKEQGGTWYLGSRSFADAYLYVLERWADQTPFKLTDTPLLQDHMHRMESDEGVQKALKRQDMTPMAKQSQ